MVVVKHKFHRFVEKERVINEEIIKFCEVQIKASLNLPWKRKLLLKLKGSVNQVKFEGDNQEKKVEHINQYNQCTEEFRLAESRSSQYRFIYYKENIHL